MKYIRTKDGVYKDVGNGEKNGEYLVQTNSHSCRFYIFPNDILKQADTIEELCDEFVVDYCGKHLIEIEEEDESKTIYFKDQFDYGYDLIDFLERHTIYGAIWTDKGLIYVAKMNEKGEMELI